MNEAFFTLHCDVPREGPGDAASVAWAMDLAGRARDARILDAGAGPGADIAGLLTGAPEGHVTAIEAHAPFVERIRTAWAGDARVTAHVGDMGQPGGPYDFIWCAGALYFLGITDGLKAWRDVLTPGGAIAFSELTLFAEHADPDVLTLREGYPAFAGLDTLKSRIDAAGYELLGLRQLPDAAWEAYFQPLETRIAMLRPGADDNLTAVLDEQAAEIALWRRARDQFGYTLAVVRPQ
ncbi:class I SAM-dependent methyltransferase [Aliiroseovarius sp.]|uniref:class I SAM-dependent methyltransferase n=1 Tax=Aliiroseovarius sp. TaxID=1872442 RepID=UPI0026214159|nr:class I SAM-dependent methyltransferase [Aliiroseovarius sp.]